jgi:hypothetical protein
MKLFRLMLLSLLATDPLAIWSANALKETRVVGIAVVGIGIVIVGIRLILSSLLASEHQNIIAKSGIIVLIIGGVMIIGSSGMLTLLYNLAGVAQ